MISKYQINATKNKEEQEKKKEQNIAATLWHLD